MDREAFDLVFTGVGALCWLPDIDRWAAVVRGLLAPGGRLFLREGHQTMWSLDALPGQMELMRDGEWRLRTGPERLPLTYTLQAVRPD